MSEAARVVRLSGYGNQQLMDAIRSGMVSADAARAYKRVLEENERLKRENRNLRMELQVVRRSRKTERQCKVEAYRMVLAKDAEHQKWRTWRFSAGVLLFGAGGVVTAIATMLAVMLA